MSALPRQSTQPEPAPPVAALPSTAPDVMAKVREAYSFFEAWDETQALALLAHRPDVAAVLIEALPHVYAIFGKGTPIRLIAVDDHTGEPITLSARIKASDPGPDSRTKRDAFYRSWWNRVSGEIDDVLSFGITYA